MSANIWNPSDEGLLVADTTALAQHYVVSDTGQSVFAISNFTYIPGTNSIVVYINGVFQRSGIDYAETDGSSITFISHVFVVGDTVSIIGSVGVDSAPQTWGTAQEVFVATAGQTVFVTAHVVTTNQLTVYINGLRQERDDAYTITGANTVVFSEPLELGDEVTLSINFELAGAEAIWPGSSVDTQVAVFNGTTGNSLKAVTLTGMAKMTGGVIEAATPGIDYVIPAAVPAQFNPTAGANITLSGTYPNITFNAIGDGTGNVSGPASATNSQIALFDGTTGKLIKAATTSGILKASSGVIAAAVAGTDYVTPASVPAQFTPTAGTNITLSGTYPNITFNAAGTVVGPASSTDNQIALLSGTTGKLIKAATTTGLLKASSGVISAAVAGTDYVIPSAVPAQFTPIAGTNITLSGTYPNITFNAPASDPVVVVIGDSISDNLTARTSSWSTIYEKMIKECGDSIQLFNLAIGGSTCYSARIDTSLGGTTMVQKAIAASPDVVIIQLGYNDATSARTLGEIQGDLLGLVTDIKTALPATKVLFAQELCHDMQNYPTTGSLINAGCLPFDFQLPSSGIYAGAYSEYMLTQAASSAAKAKIDKLMAFNSYGAAIPSLTGTYVVDYWKIARLGCLMNDNIHPTFAGQQLLAHSNLSGLASVAAITEFPKFKAMSSNILGILDGIFDKSLLQSGGVWIDKAPDTEADKMAYELGLERKFNPTSWYYPYRTKFSVHISSGTNSPNYIQIENGPPKAAIYYSAGGASFLAVPTTTTANGEAILTIPADYTGAGDFIKCGNEIYGPFNLLANAGPSGTGDVTGPSSAVANQIALFDGTTGKLIKAATTSGILKSSSGVIAAATAGTDYVIPSAVPAQFAPVAGKGMTLSGTYPNITFTATAPLIQSGSDATSATPTVTFPVAFKAGTTPILIISVVDPRTDRIMAPQITGITASNFSLRKTNFVSILGIDNYAVTWVAIGEAA